MAAASVPVEVHEIARFARPALWYRYNLVVEHGVSAGLVDKWQLQGTHLHELITGQYDISWQKE